MSFLETMVRAKRAVPLALAIYSGLNCGSGGGGGGTDLPPTVAITAPAQNATVSGLGQFGASFSDDDNLTNTSLKLNGIQVYAATPGATSATANVQYNADTLRVGKDTLIAIAKDNSNQTRADTSIFTVSHSPTPTITSFTVNPLATLQGDAVAYALQSQNATANSVDVSATPGIDAQGAGALSGNYQVGTQSFSVTGRAQDNLGRFDQQVKNVSVTPLSGLVTPQPSSMNLGQQVNLQVAAVAGTDSSRVYQRETGLADALVGTVIGATGSLNATPTKIGNAQYVMTEFNGSPAVSHTESPVNVTVNSAPVPVNYHFVVKNAFDTTQVIPGAKVPIDGNLVVADANGIVNYQATKGSTHNFGIVQGPANIAIEPGSKYELPTSQFPGADSVRVVWPHSDWGVGATVDSITANNDINGRILVPVSAGPNFDRAHFDYTFSRANNVGMQGPRHDVLYFHIQTTAQGDSVLIQDITPQALADWTAFVQRVQSDTAINRYYKRIHVDTSAVMPPWTDSTIVLAKGSASNNGIILGSNKEFNGAVATIGASGNTIADINSEGYTGPYAATTLFDPLCRVSSNFNGCTGGFNYAAAPSTFDHNEGLVMWHNFGKHAANRALLKPNGAATEYFRPQ